MFFRIKRRKKSATFFAQPELNKQSCVFKSLSSQSLCVKAACVLHQGSDRPDRLGQKSTAPTKFGVKRHMAPGKGGWGERSENLSRSRKMGRTDLALGSFQRIPNC